MATGSTSQAKARSARPATHPGQTSASRCCALSGEVRDPAAVPLPPWAIVMAVSRTHYGLIKQYRFTNCADLWCVNVIALKRTHIGNRTGQVATISVRAGQNVTSGQVLATEAAVPAATAVMASDKAAIGVDEVALAQFGNQSVQAEGISLATAQATLAKDKAQLALDQAAVVLGDQPDPPLSGMVAAVQLAS